MTASFQELTLSFLSLTKIKNHPAMVWFRKIFGTYSQNSLSNWGLIKARPKALVLKTDSAKFAFILNLISAEFVPKKQNFDI
jgi:hypothetical protein